MKKAETIKQICLIRTELKENELKFFSSSSLRAYLKALCANDSDCFKDLGMDYLINVQGRECSLEALGQSGVKMDNDIVREDLIETIAGLMARSYIKSVVDQSGW